MYKKKFQTTNQLNVLVYLQLNLKAWGMVGDGFHMFPRLKNLRTDVETRRGLSMVALDAAWPRIIVDPVGCAQHKEPSYRDKGEDLHGPLNDHIIQIHSPFFSPGTY